MNKSKVTNSLIILPFGGFRDSFYLRELWKLWGFGSLFFLVFAFSAAGQTLDDYLKTAAENNPEVKSAYAQFEAAMQQAPQVSSLPDPTLTMSAFGRMIETRVGAQEARFSLMQMFPWFGTLRAREDASVLMAEAKFQEYLNVRNELFLNIKTLYAELYALEEIVELKTDNLKILDSYRELALSGFRSGNSAMVNVVKIDMQRAGATTELELLEEQKRPLQVRLNLLLNRNPEEAIQVQDTLLFSSNFSAEGFSENFNNHPGVTRLKKQKEAYEVQKVIAEKEGLPMVGLGVDYSVISKRTDANPEMNGRDAVMPMLSVSLPIFRKKYKAAQKEAELMAESMEYEKESMRNELQARYSAALYRLNRAKKLINLYDRQLVSSNQANTLLVSAFGSATGNFEEVLQTNQDILMLRIQKIEAIQEGFTAQAEMEYLFSITE